MPRPDPLIWLVEVKVGIDKNKLFTIYYWGRINARRYDGQSIKDEVDKTVFVEASTKEHIHDHRHGHPVMTLLRNTFDRPGTHSKWPFHHGRDDLHFRPVCRIQHEVVMDLRDLRGLWGLRGLWVLRAFPVNWIPLPLYVARVCRAPVQAHYQVELKALRMNNPGRVQERSSCNLVFPYVGGFPSSPRSLRHRMDLNLGSRQNVG